MLFQARGQGQARQGWLDLLRKHPCLVCLPQLRCPAGSPGRECAAFPQKHFTGSTLCTSVDFLLNRLPASGEQDLPCAAKRETGCQGLLFSFLALPGRPGNVGALSAWEDLWLGCLHRLVRRQRT